MTPHPIRSHLLKQFRLYTTPFLAQSRTGDGTLYKVYHTLRVAHFALNIARRAQLPDDLVEDAFCAAMAHDLGRFIQIRQSGSFRDEGGFDHGAEGRHLLEEYPGFLPSLSTRRREEIHQAVYWHNKPALPSEGLNERARLLCGILRDADKMDILRAMDRFYQFRILPPRHLELGLPEDPVPSPDVRTRFREGQPVAYRQLQTAGDFRLLQIGWKRDLHLPQSAHLPSWPDHIRFRLSMLEGLSPEETRMILNLAKR